MNISENLTVKEALLLHYKEADLPPDGGVKDRWFIIKLGPIKIPLPNPKIRKRTVPFHDMHHLVTGYNTVLTQGETEVAAWEIAGGMGDHWLGWWLNMQAVFLGLLVNRKNTLRAFMKGIHTKNIYNYHDPNVFKSNTLRQLREKIGLTKEEPKVTPEDRKRLMKTLWVGFGIVLLTRVVLLTLLGLIVIGIIKLF